MSTYKERILLDRYAIKDATRELLPGDMVVVSRTQIFEQEERPVESREIGHVVRRDGGHYDVRLDDETKEVLAAVPRDRLEYCVEQTYQDICERVAGAVANGDTDFESDIFNLMIAEKFIPAGRPLAGIGRDDYDLTLFNCYVFALDGDSRASISRHWARLFETYSRGGGIGWNLSILRPKGAVVKKVNGRSSGSVSWAEQFSQITGAVEQGGCFAGDTKIETDRGDIPAREVAELVETQKYGKVCVMTHVGFQPITAVFRNGVKPTVELAVDAGHSIYDTVVSLDHKVVGKGGTEPVPGLSGWTFVRAGDLAPGDIVAVLGQPIMETSDPPMQSSRCSIDEAKVFSVREVGEAEVFDFEVYKTHLLASNRIYTSNSRRGAGLQGLEVWHPDIEEFIGVKAQRKTFKTEDGQVISRNENLLKNSNVSVLITSGFIEAVEQDTDWDLVFPDLQDPEYDTVWDGDLERWRGMGKNVITYRTVKARELWNSITQRAWESGEPGIIFLDRCNEMSNSYYYNRITCTNPCGEENLPPNAVCNLSHINLAKFTTPSCTLPEQERTAADAAKLVDWGDMTAAIHTGIRFLDAVIDLNRYHEDAIEKQQTSERRIGLGFLGYGELLIRLGLRYGSEESLKFTDRLMKHFSSQSYLASVELAKEHGAFPAFEVEPFLKSGFMKRHAKKVKDAVVEHGIRNVTVNTVAPTGSVGSLLQTSGGCEPFFDLEYTSTTRIGVVRERVPVLQLLLDHFGPDRKNWPEYVVTAQQGITPTEHARTQGAIQRWIDASISKTVNLPNSAEVQDIADAYLEMWRCGCKGGTVYRDGSRDEQVLYANQEATVEVVEESAETEVIPRRPDVGHSITFSEESPVGTVHATLRHDSVSGDVRDLFVTVAKGDISADAEAIGRLCSMILGWPNNKYVNQQTRLELIRNQLIDILGRGQVGFGPMAKRSLPDTIAKIINRYLEADFPAANLPVGRNQMESLLNEVRELAGDPEAFDKLKRYVLDGDLNGNGDEPDSTSPEDEIQQAEADGIKLPYDICPYCGNVTLVRIPGKCSYCRQCGESMC